MSIFTAPLCARAALCLQSLVVLGLTAAFARADDAAQPAQTQPAAASQPAAPAAAPTEVTAAGLTWHTDYSAAYRAAKNSKRMLLINFVRATGPDSTQQNAERT